MMSKREIEDEEIDINVDDDDDPFDKTFNAKSEKVSFSISNILSDTFGPKTVKVEQNQNERILFQPFETKSFFSNSASNTVSSKSIVQNPSSVFLSNFRLYSTKHETFPHNISDLNLRNSLYNSLASYPKIHEEILNSYGHKKNSNTQQTSNLYSTQSKIPPLGGLRQTVSQIGQENLTQSAATSSDAQTNSSQSKNLLSDVVKIQQTSTDSVDSDDCTSEASTSKDESQKMWPAWVTKYIAHIIARTLLIILSPRFSVRVIPIDQVLVSFPLQNDSVRNNDSIKCFNLLFICAKASVSEIGEKLIYLQLFQYGEYK